MYLSPLFIPLGMPIVAPLIEGLVVKDERKKQRFKFPLLQAPQAALVDMLNRTGSKPSILSLVCC
jgi:hypothetical protein